jgi:hypothetical protein
MLKTITPMIWTDKFETIHVVWDCCGVTYQVDFGSWLLLISRARNMAPTCPTCGARGLTYAEVTQNTKH